MKKIWKKKLNKYDNKGKRKIIEKVIKFWYVNFLLQKFNLETGFQKYFLKFSTNSNLIPK